MAEVKSLGVHTPVALPYLISEGILQEEPKKDLYQWDTYVFNGSHGDVEEEILATKHCVVWSRGKFIRKVYRFEVEGEEVVQAVLTDFSAASATGVESAEKTKKLRNGCASPKEVAYPFTGRPNERSQGELSSDSGTSCRALVVFLKSKAHIYFTQGSSYIIDLPIAVDRAFPTPCGVLIQSKASQRGSSPPTPQIPAPPPNSFLSSQIPPSSSYLQSPSFAKSFGSAQPARPSPLRGNNRLDAIFQDTLGTLSQAEEDLAPLYSLKSPLSEFGVVTYSIQRQKPRVSAKGQPGLIVEFETLDPAEDIVYVSPKDELANAQKQGRGPFMLIVTANTELQTLTVWHAWYINEKSLASRMKQRAVHKAAKARRRSSFLSAGMGNGTATPAVRHREGTRESFAAAGSMRLPSEQASSHPTAASSRKPTRQEEEDAMASQMDPDYQPTASQQNARESRRISSLNADVRASQGAVNASFGGPGGRRNASFGGVNERRSFGHRKSRGSTPGSVFSRSLGPEDDIMDVDSSMDADGEESIDSVVRHIRATFDAAGADSIFRGAEGDFKRDLVVRKLHSFEIAWAPGRAGSTTSVVTLGNTLPLQESEDQRLNVYVHDSSTKNLACLSLLITYRPLWSEMDGSPYIAVPIITGETKLGQCTDIIKLNDNNTEAVLLADRGLILSVGDNSIYPLPSGAPYKMYNQLEAVSTQSQMDKEIGKNRTVQGPSPGTYSLMHGGAKGRSDEVTSDGVYHRRQIKLRPDDRWVDKLLEVCRIVLPTQQTQVISGMWCTAHAWLVAHPETSEGTAMDFEWIAFATTVLGFAIHLIDDKARASLNISQLVAKQGSAAKFELLSQQQKDRLSRQTPWRWIKEKPASSQDGRTRRKDNFLVIAAALADQLIQSPLWNSSGPSAQSPGGVVRLMLALHILSEEQKLCTLNASAQKYHTLAAIIAQLGNWLGMPFWDCTPGQYYEMEGVSDERWSFVKTTASRLTPPMPLMQEPVGVFQWFEHCLKARSSERYPSLETIAALDRTSPLSEAFRREAAKLTPRITALSDVLEATSALTADAAPSVELMAIHGITPELMESLPIAIAAPFKNTISKCEREPPTTWSANLLSLVRRDDLFTEAVERHQSPPKTQMIVASTPRDIQTICNALDHHPHSVKTKEASRHAVSQLIFSEDRRLVDAASLMHFNTVQVAECPKQPDWSDAHHLEQQRRIMQWVTVRMIALPAGDAMIHYDSQTPLLTDKYHLSGFSNSCLMQPMGHTLTTDRSGLTEEKVNWAYFHAGVSVGLRISRNIKGIDTSWIAFNKPNELTNRHAGLLLALGLGGHLRHLAKWLSFKYLTPKHTMTSVGLLLGLSASYMGTMDGLITRMLSVHITRMLPPGAAELNISPVTQTAGLMGIGLLYYHTQHRRMSEIMLSEVEHMELEDPDSGPDPLRDESYRLAAGFALGFINLGKGRDLRGLHGMYLPERLLAVAVGPRPVNAVHVFDRATAGAVIAVALVYMKSGDKAIARKIDIPDTEAQFDHVRPDVLMLRAMAKHLILWDSIETKEGPRGIPTWIYANIPMCYSSRFLDIHAAGGSHPLKSSDIPFFNIATGLGWVLSLKYAGSGDTRARDEILLVLDIFYMVQGCGGGSSSTRFFNYDAKLTRSTVRRCIDILALSAATIMAGTGDLKTFRYLRRLHGRTDSETPYGSHLAAHLAIGVLILGGGTYTFGTSDLAIAALICAFYPLYPTDVHDNHVHLQAFRHFWVFAAEARCLVVEDIDTQRPISMPITLTLTNGSTKSLTAPCLIPELDNIATIQTNDPTYWRVTLDFAQNPEHLSAFKANQRIFVRRCPASEAHSSVFSATLSALNDAQQSSSPAAKNPQAWKSIFNLPVFKDLDKADLELILPPDLNSSVYMDEVGTVVDDRLELSKDVDAVDRDKLWYLRLLFTWAEKARDAGEERLNWIGYEVVERLKARVEERRRTTEPNAEP